jgi:tripartite ATP-independent transporter DctM subunit
MSKGDLTPKIMRLASLMVGRTPGGLAQVMVVSSMLFGAISGSGVANVVAIGTLVTPMMREQRYNMRFSAALLGCSGALGTIIPPSIVMVVLGVTMGVSIGRLFLAGVIPGILLGIGLMIVAWFLAKKNDYPRAEAVDPSQIATILKEAILPMGAPVIILVGFRGGFFTATETGAIVALYAMIVSGLIYRKLTFRDFMDVCYSSALTSASVLLIIASASLFGWVMALEQIPQRVAETVLSISTNYWAVLLLFNLLLLVLGLFMETIAIIIIIVPVFMPVMEQIGVDPIHLGVIIAVNLAIGANTPPMGVSLIAACKVANVSYYSSFRYVFPFVGVMAFVMLLLILFPGLSTWLPNMLIQ